MMFVMQWERVINGQEGHPPSYSATVLLATVTITGLLDGICVGALFGEAAVLGPGSAHVRVTQAVVVLQGGASNRHSQSLVPAAFHPLTPPLSHWQQCSWHWQQHMVAVRCLFLHPDVPVPRLCLHLRGWLCRAHRVCTDLPVHLCTMSAAAAKTGHKQYSSTAVNRPVAHHGW